MNCRRDFWNRLEYLAGFALKGCVHYETVSKSVLDCQNVWREEGGERLQEISHFSQRTENLNC